MSAGNRGIIAAAIGWLILVGAAPQERAKDHGEQPKAKTETRQSAPTASTAPTKPPEIVNRPVLERPCGQGQYDRQSDLCAQWKAADAASEAAWWAMVATFVTALGTFGLFWQIKLTREAVRSTGDATIAMQKANDLAILGRRPWVSAQIEPKFVGCIGGIFVVEAIATFRNLGASPATSANATIDLIETKFNFDNSVKEKLADWRNMKQTDSETILPGEMVTRHLSFNKPVDEMHFMEESDHPTIIFVVIAVAVHYKSGSGLPDDWLETSRSFILKRRVKTIGRSDQGFALSGFPRESFEVLPESLIVEHLPGERAT